MKSYGKRHTKCEIRELVKSALNSDNPAKALTNLISSLIAKKTPFALLRPIGDEIGEAGLREPERIFSLLKALFVRNGECSFNTKELRASDQRRKGFFYGGFGVVISWAIKRMMPVYRKRTAELAKEYILATQYWSAADAIGFYSFRDIFEEDADSAFCILESWAKDQNKWVRRAAVYAVVSYVDRPGRDIEKVNTILEYVMEDREKECKRVVGIALRHYAKNYREELNRHKSLAKFLKLW
jgi:hypothetical protein